MISRGAICWASEKGVLTSKPRPVLVVQSDGARDHTTITVCLISTVHVPDAFFRIRVDPTPENGLDHVSYIQADRLFSLRKDSFDRRLGVLDVLDQRRVDAALRRWLDL